ncbi:MAG: 3-ketosteroid-9-alpha-hydroxylase, partial [Proteobacteria bacterium]
MTTTTTKYPKGWFVVCFSDDVPVGGTKQLHYFGEELVAFRGEDGVVRVLDGYCAHMGANLGAGGKVCGNTIQCPFHAWKFSGTGECVEIPYAKKIPLKARQRVWLTREVNGVVLVHHDALGGAPDYDIPVIEDYGSVEWLPWTKNMYTIKTHPREIIENIADKGHFPMVHDTEIEDFTFEVDRHMAHQYVKGKALIRGGGVDNFASKTTYHGPGYLIMRMDGALKNYMLVAHTPRDEGSVDLRMGVMLKIVGNAEKTQGYVGQYMTNLKAGFEDDIRIWENKLYRETPVLCDGDGPITQARRWYRQFYVRETPGAAQEQGQ